MTADGISFLARSFLYIEKQNIIFDRVHGLIDTDINLSGFTVLVELSVWLYAISYLMTLRHIYKLNNNLFWLLQICFDCYKRLVHLRVVPVPPPSPWTAIEKLPPLPKILSWSLGHHRTLFPKFFSTTMQSLEFLIAHILSVKHHLGNSSSSWIWKGVSATL